MENGKLVSVRVIIQIEFILIKPNSPSCSECGMTAVLIYVLGDDGNVMLTDSEQTILSDQFSKAGTEVK
ncbi:MAG: hypothetical protein ACR2GW_11545 [Pyrinomonadaceae bacterium]